MRKNIIVKERKKKNIFSFDIFISRRCDRRIRNMIEYNWILSKIKEYNYEEDLSFK
jgi:hypothetical protein